jgi:hypothetical protein
MATFGRVEVWIDGESSEDEPRTARLGSFFSALRANPGLLVGVLVSADDTQGIQELAKAAKSKDHRDEVDTFVLATAALLDEGDNHYIETDGRTLDKRKAYVHGNPELRKEQRQLGLLTIVAAEVAVTMMQPEDSQPIPVPPRAQAA